jgi:hypothetical protein
MQTERTTMPKKTVVDFTNTDSSGGRVRLPEDNYKVRVKSVKHETSRNGNPMLVWEFEVTEGKYKGKVLRERTVLQENSLWKLKQVLEAMGINVPSKRVALDLARYPGKELGVAVVDDEPYEGKVSSKVSDYMDVDVLDEDDEEEEEYDEDDEEEEEEPTPRKKGKKSRKVVSDEEEIEDLNLDEI